MHKALKTAIKRTTYLFFILCAGMIAMAGFATYMVTTPAGQQQYINLLKQIELQAEQAEKDKIKGLDQSSKSATIK
jgi:hypothetical protein